MSMPNTATEPARLTDICPCPVNLNQPSHGERVTLHWRPSLTWRGDWTQLAFNDFSTSGEWLNYHFTGFQNVSMMVGTLSARLIKGKDTNIALAIKQSESADTWPPKQKTMSTRKKILGCNHLAYLLSKKYSIVWPNVTWLPTILFEIWILF